MHGHPSLPISKGSQTTTLKTRGNLAIARTQTLRSGRAPNKQPAAPSSADRRPTQEGEEKRSRGQLPPQGLGGKRTQAHSTPQVPLLGQQGSTHNTLTSLQAATQPGYHQLSQSYFLSSPPGVPESHGHPPPPQDTLPGAIQLLLSISQV
ncbi:hypothetical protein KIL84_008244 [Mauremys mutica]|uniref:Uncharacterized protein n=1 Tax=Mauremys mutica TaxID=74926 RepID=A0A9D3XA96_9SAUR|nr:hypothetical protein KIL84_008244 [Mauremys mutica]